MQAQCAPTDCHAQSGHYDYLVVVAGVCSLAKLRLFVDLLPDASAARLGFKAMGA